MEIIKQTRYVYIFNELYSFLLYSHTEYNLICLSVDPFRDCLPGTELLQSIVEETLTSGKYVSLFLILIIYKILKNMWRPTYFLKKYAKTDNQRKLRKWREQMHLICCYSSSENINCHSIQAARKKYANNIKRALDFYYYSPFLYGNI